MRIAKQHIGGWILATALTAAITHSGAAVEIGGKNYDGTNDFSPNITFAGSTYTIQDAVNTWNSGNVEVQSGITLLNPVGSTVTFESGGGGGSRTLTDDGTLRNEGSFVHNGSGDIDFSGSTHFENAGLFEFAANGDVDLRNQSDTRFVNETGSILRKSGTGTARLFGSNGGAPKFISQNSTIEVTDTGGVLEIGTVNQTGGESYDSTFTVAANAKLELNMRSGGPDTRRMYWSGTIEGSGLGVVDINTQVNIGNLAGAGTLTLNISDGNTAVTDAGGVEFSGLVHDDSGTFGSANPKLFNTGKMFTSAGNASDVKIDDFDLFSNSGQIFHNGSGDLVIEQGDAPSVVIENGGLIELRGMGGIDIGRSDSNRDSLVIAEGGTLRRSTTATTVSVSYFGGNDRGVTIEDGANIEVTAGRLNVSPRDMNFGAGDPTSTLNFNVLVANNSTLKLGGGDQEVPLIDTVGVKGSVDMRGASSQLLGDTNSSRFTADNTDILQGSLATVQGGLFVSDGFVLTPGNGGELLVDGGTLGGNSAGVGGIAGNVTATNGATLAPGLSIGQLDIIGAAANGDLTFAGPATIELEILDGNGVAGIDFDLLNVLGDVDFGGDLITIQILMEAGFDPGLDFTDMHFLAAGSANTLSNFDLVWDPIDAADGTFSLDSRNDGLYLNFEAFVPSGPAVPEPMSATLVVLGLVGVMSRRRRAA